MTKRVAVLKGGFSGEREVSLSSAAGIEKAVVDLGYELISVDVTRDIKKLVETLTSENPDVALNILHGRWGEDGCIQGLLELMGIPYTHSGVLGSSVSMNKDATIRICQRAGIKCPEGKLISIDDAKAGKFPFPKPFVIKPIGEGSSIGVSIILDDNSPLPDFNEWPYGSSVLIEKYIPGREIHVAVLGGRALGAIEIRPKSGFYDYNAKYTDGMAEHIYPAPIHPDAYKQALAMAEKAHEVLDCKGISRSDFRYDDTKGEPGEMYLLEVNPQPGMTPLSLVPEIASYNGYSYKDLVDWMIKDASCPR